VIKNESMKRRTPGPWIRKDRLGNDETTAADAEISWSPPGERGTRLSFIHDRHREAHARDVPRGSSSSEVENSGALVNKAMDTHVGRGCLFSPAAQTHCRGAKIVTWGGCDAFGVSGPAVSALAIKRWWHYRVECSIDETDPAFSLDTLVSGTWNHSWRHD